MNAPAPGVTTIPPKFRASILRENGQSPLPFIVRHREIQSLSFCALDFESAGAASGRTDVPVQIGLALWSPVDGYGDDFVSFLHSEQPITWSAQKVHGITPADLREAPTFLSLWPTLKTFLGQRVLVAHGHGTEKRFLRTFPGHPFGPWVDTLTIARTAWPSLPKYSLGFLCDHFGLSKEITAACPDRQWHDALYDSVASLHLLAHVIESLEIEHKPLLQLNPK
jgi:DNA polymerase-3 subunit epsilon